MEKSSGSASSKQKNTSKSPGTGPDSSQKNSSYLEIDVLNSKIKRKKTPQSTESNSSDFFNPRKNRKNSELNSPISNLVSGSSTPNNLTIAHGIDSSVEKNSNYPNEKNSELQPTNLGNEIEDSQDQTGETDEIPESKTANISQNLILGHFQKDETCIIILHDWLGL